MFLHKPSSGWIEPLRAVCLTLLILTLKDNVAHPRRRRMLIPPTYLQCHPVQFVLGSAQDHHVQPTSCQLHKWDGTTGVSNK